MKKSFSLAFILFLLFSLTARAEEAMPKKFVFDQGNAIFSGYNSLLLANGKLLFYVNRNNSRDKLETIKVTPEKWAEFRRALDHANVWNWQSEYKNPEVADGTQWNFKIEYSDGKTITSQGDNAFPLADGTSNHSPEKSPAYLELTKALTNLTGKKW